MKKYNTLTLSCSLLYLDIAAFLRWSILQMEETMDYVYCVEINHILQQVEKNTKAEDIAQNNYLYIEKLQWLSAEEGSRETASAFLQEGNNLEMHVASVYRKQKLIRYLRFDCHRSPVDTNGLMLRTQLFLAALFAMLLGVLLYPRKYLLKPLDRVRRLPDELAKGHWKGIVKEGKGRCAHDFLLGIGQSKDSLDISRRRQLELEKEKRRLLLSLSHDTKTPLNTIQLYVRALEEHLYTDETQNVHAAHQIQEEGKEIEHYVEEITKQPRHDILDIQVQNSELYLKELIDKTAYAYKEPLRLRRMEPVAKSYENLLLKGDLERSPEVVENIMESALKYGDGRRIEISCYEEGYCQLVRIFNIGNTVSDTESHYIFESFFRASSSEGKQGNGLGLYICRETMRRMNVETLAEKETDGMAFLLVFPYRIPNGAAACKCRYHGCNALLGIREERILFHVL